MENVTVKIEFSQEQVLEEIILRATGQLVERLEQKLKADITERVTDVIDNQVNEIVRGVLTRSFQPTTMFGTAQGAPTSLEEILAKKAETYLNEKVDSQGRTTTDSYGTKQLRAHWILSQLYEAQFNTSVKREVASLVERTKNKAYQAIAETVLKEIAVQASRKT